MSLLILKLVAQLPQWNSATRYLCKFTLCFTKYGS